MGRPRRRHCRQPFHADVPREPVRLRCRRPSPRRRTSSVWRSSTERADRSSDRSTTSSVSCVRWSCTAALPCLDAAARSRRSAGPGTPASSDRWCLGCRRRTRAAARSRPWPLAWSGDEEVVRRRATSETGGPSLRSAGKRASVGGSAGLSRQSSASGWRDAGDTVSRRWQSAVGEADSQTSWRLRRPRCRRGLFLVCIHSQTHPRRHRGGSKGAGGRGPL